MDEWTNQRTRSKEELEAATAASEEAATAAIEAAAAAEDDAGAQKEALEQLKALLEESRGRTRELGKQLQASRVKCNTLEAELEARDPNSRKNKAKAKQQASKEASKPQITDGQKQHALDEVVIKLTGDAARRGLRPKSKIASKRR